MRRKAFSIAFSCIITAVVLGLLLQKTSVQDIVKTIAMLPVMTLIGAFLLYTLVQALRACRAWTLLQKAVPLDTLFSITCIHNALINILPARTGEFGYVYLVQRTGKATTGAGIGTLILARLCDLIAIAAIFFVALLAARVVPPSIQALRMPLLAGLFLLVSALMSIMLLRKQAVATATAVLRAFHLEQVRLFAWLLRKFEETLHHLQVMKSWKTLLGALAWSIGIWMVLFTINFMIFRAVGIPFTWEESTMATSVAALLAVIPIQGLVGLGTTEAWWTLGLASVNVSTAQAIQAGFAQHLSALVFMAVLGLYGLIRSPWNKK
ncbi:MAG TPA: lysylphosphatidylglycerol synthase transmembrane domain-containing protein [Candidatus Binatia bacterium]|nr:lysylphosphatidylglycerol synthase transmembrane domain-containing protein [Candidatus Binatia bacterium]